MDIDNENTAEKTAKDEEPMELDGNSEEKRQSLIEVKQILCPILHPGLNGQTVSSIMLGETILFDPSQKQ